MVSACLLGCAGALWGAMLCLRVLYHPFRPHTVLSPAQELMPRRGDPSWQALLSQWVTTSPSTGREGNSCTFLPQTQSTTVYVTCLRKLLTLSPCLQHCSPTQHHALPWVLFCPTCHWHFKKISTFLLHLTIQPNNTNIPPTRYFLIIISSLHLFLY